MCITISCVDGESFYSCKGSRRLCYEFLLKHDHEGSSLTLHRDNYNPIYNPDVIYKLLSEESNDN